MMAFAANGHSWRTGLGALAFLALLLPSAPDASAGIVLKELKSRHYNIHTDLDRPLAEDLARRLDAMYDEYGRRLATFVADKKVPPLEVYLFRRQEDYLEFTGHRLKNTGGVYMSGRNILAAFLEGQGRDALRRTLQHEAFHQFAHNAISPDLPVWLNEGMAQLFEEGIWTGGEFLLGQVPPRRVRQLQADIKHRRLVDFERFMAMTPETWASHLRDDHGAGATHYNQAWAMVYFLVHAKDARTGREKYRARMLQFLELLHAGKSGAPAFEAAFSANMRGFQSRFVEFARVLRPTPEATLIEHQTVLADLMIGLRDRGQVFDSITDFRNTCLEGKFSLHYSRGQIEWKTDANLETYFSDLHGRVLRGDELYLIRRPGAPLPDIVCRADRRFTLRTRFHAQGAKVDYEVLVEPPAAQARTSD